jgi:hypothetical protein
MGQPIGPICKGLWFLTVEDWTDWFFRNVGKKLSLLAAFISQCVTQVFIFYEVKRCVNIYIYIILWMGVLCQVTWCVAISSIEHLSEGTMNAP